MRISFDLDDVLFVSPKTYETEPAPRFPYDRLRYLRRLFRLYGIRFDEIVNGERHKKEVQRDRKERLPMKLPNFYRIDLHVDDEKSVRDNALRYGYRVMRVMEPDEHWIERVLREAERVYRLEQIKLTHENEE